MLSGAEELRFGTYPSILATVVTIVAGAVLLAFPHTASFGVAVLACLSIAVFFYNLIWQYGRIDAVLGGVPKISHLYSSAFILLLYGYIAVAGWFLLEEAWLGVMGGYSIVAGILLAQWSNTLLLDNFVNGRRWRLAESAGSRG